MNVIDPQEVSIVWTSNKYDGTLITGHCWYKEQYCYIASNGPWSKEIVFKVYKLEGQTLINELAHRKLFEDIVGYHLTSNVKPYQPCNDRQSMDLYYKNMINLIPKIEVKDLEELGGWTIDNSKYWDGEDDEDGEEGLDNG